MAERLTQNLFWCTSFNQEPRYLSITGGKNVITKT